MSPKSVGKTVRCSSRKKKLCLSGEGTQPPNGMNTLEFRVIVPGVHDALGPLIQTAFGGSCKRHITGLKRAKLVCPVFNQSFGGIAPSIVL